MTTRTTPNALSADMASLHLAGARFALRCWLCSASADVVMRRVYGALLVAMLVVCFTTATCMTPLPHRAPFQMSLRTGDACERPLPIADVVDDFSSMLRVFNSNECSMYYTHVLHRA